MDRPGEATAAVENQQTELPAHPRFTDSNQDLIVFEKFGLLEAATATKTGTSPTDEPGGRSSRNPVRGARATLRVSATTPQPKITIGSLPEDDMI